MAAKLLGIYPDSWSSRSWYNTLQSQTRSILQFHIWLQFSFQSPFRESILCWCALLKSTEQRHSCSRALPPGSCWPQTTLCSLWWQALCRRLAWERASHALWVSWRWYSWSRRSFWYSSSQKSPCEPVGSPAAPLDWDSLVLWSWIREISKLLGHRTYQICWRPRREFPYQSSAALVDWQPQTTYPPCRLSASSFHICIQIHLPNQTNEHIDCRLLDPPTPRTSL